ncbi:MAG: TIGR03560 family F420-dependent LLM class oxidoreductase, partial [Thermomicrobiales bacterium]
MAIDVSIMIEGQDGLSWPRWQRLARAAEDLGFYGLYRSDHFTNPQGPVQDDIETWISLGWLAATTSRICFGTMVSPLSFRNPSILAWQASSIDALAGGRLRLGVGAGWQEREHHSFGFDLLATSERFARLEEGIRIVKSLTRSSEPTTIEGQYYQIRDAMLQPRSPRTDRPAIVIGGNGPKRTLPLVAKYADEWNSIYPKLDAYGDLMSRLDELLA